MKETKSIIFTIGITFFLLLFLAFLIYTVYCYLYYDTNLENTYLNKYNEKDYAFIYDNLDNVNDLTFNDFKEPLDLMYNKTNLKNIYYLYYQENNIFKDLDEFINTYYYGDRLITKDNVVWTKEGQTNLFHRQTIKYKSINLVNKNNYQTSLGLKNNITLRLDSPNQAITLDNQELACSNNTCLIPYIFGGLHQLHFTTNQEEYYTLLNIKEDNEIIDITELKNLVLISKKEEIDNLESHNELSEPHFVQPGIYTIKKCLKDNNCADKRHSYLVINEDYTVTYNLYIPFENATDKYEGNYKIIGDFIYFQFNSHIYSLFDYDTKKITDIHSNDDIEITYKINTDTELINQDYQFIYNPNYQIKE